MQDEEGAKIPGTRLVDRPGDLGNSISSSRGYEVELSGRWAQFAKRFINFLRHQHNLTVVLAAGCCAAGLMRDRSP